MLDPFSLSPFPEACYVTSFLLMVPKIPLTHTPADAEHATTLSSATQKAARVYTCLLRGQV